jgi:hypothetical protein
MPSAEDAPLNVPRPELVAAWLVLHDLDTRSVPVWAAWWLVTDDGGPAVCDLAGLSGLDPFDVRDALIPALNELGIRTPALADACRLAFTDRAERCLGGEVDESELAAWVERIYIWSGYDHEVLHAPLGAIYGIDDEWRGSWGRTEAELREAVRAACREQIAVATD